MIEKIKSFFALLVTGTGAGIGYGLALTIALLFLRYHPIWSILMTAAVSLFLRARLKLHWRDKNWLAFLITFPFAFFCIGFPVSLLWIAVVISNENMSFDAIDGLLAAFCATAGGICGGIYFLLTGLWQNSRPGQILDQIKRGSRIITNLNEN